MVRFRFVIPKDVPSSMYFKEAETDPNMPKAKVKYFIKARFKCEDPERSMVYK